MVKIGNVWRKHTKRMEGDPLDWRQAKSWLQNSGYLNSRKLTYIGEGAEWAGAGSSLCVLWSEDSHALIETSRNHFCAFSIRNFKIVWSELFENAVERAAVREYVETIRENLMNLREFRIEGTKHSSLDNNYDSALDRIDKQVLDISKCLDHCLAGSYEPID